MVCLEINFLKISLHASAREATAHFPVIPSCLQLISIHASARGATVCGLLGNKLLENFNPRLREGGDSAWLPIWFASGYFNPRLREGGDVYEAFYADKYFISIHASAREATKFQKCIGDLLAYFNPRLREGGDSIFQPNGTSRTISIHASAREATALITKIHLKHHISFQHTVHKSPFNVNYPFQ